MKSNRGRMGQGNKNEKIQDISDIKFRQNCTLSGNPVISSQINVEKVNKNKILRQYMACSRKNFDLWPSNDAIGRVYFWE
jgi:hypothetical protein